MQDVLSGEFRDGDDLTGLTDEKRCVMSIKPLLDAYTLEGEGYSICDRYMKYFGSTVRYQLGEMASSNRFRTFQQIGVPYILCPDSHKFQRNSKDNEIVKLEFSDKYYQRYCKSYAGIIDAINFFPLLVRNAMSSPTAAERTFVPQSDWGKLQRIALIHMAIYAATLALALWSWSLLPLMVIGLPRLYGAWHHVMTGLLQHGGLADNVIDHRLNSRTVYMNPISRFIYWNMNYHVEHHMFPMVPYHALPRLHALIRHDLPPPSPSIPAAFAEMWPALMRQLRDEEYYVQRALPATAKPYRDDFHHGALGATAAE